jgi:hypothetical protein
MSKLIHELQRDAISENCSLGELLRKSLVVAKKLRITDFELWVSHELNGYPPGSEIPKYRLVVGSIKAWNPYNGWIPVFIQDTKQANMLARRMINQAVGSLETLVSGRKGSDLQVPFSPDIEAQIMRGADLPFRPTLHIGSNQVDGILQAVRNTILTWALDLESRGILGDDMSFTSEEKQAAKEMQTINIGQFQGVLGNIQQSTVTQNLNMDVRKDDFDSLAAYLRSVGVEDAQIADLKERIKHDPVPQEKDKLGPKVSSWIGEMVSKAASGGWQLAVGTAGSLLAQAICLYYGFV